MDRRLDNLFMQLYKLGFVDSDIVYEDNTGIKNDCRKIIRNYKQHTTWTYHIVKDLLDRGYLKEDEEMNTEQCRGFILGYIMYNSFTL